MSERGVRKPDSESITALQEQLRLAPATGGSHRIDEAASKAGFGQATGRRPKRAGLTIVCTLRCRGALAAISLAYT